MPAVKLQGTQPNITSLVTLAPSTNWLAAPHSRVSSTKSSKVEDQCRDQDRPPWERQNWPFQYPVLSSGSKTHLLLLCLSSSILHFIMAAVLISVKYHHSLLLRISRPSSSPSTLTTTVIITPTIRNGSIKCRNLSLVAPPPSAGGLSSAGLSDGLPPSPSTCSPAYRRPDWLLFNDFCIAPCASAEVLTLFGNQKVPCLLYYSRVSNPPLPPSSPLQYLTSAPLLAALTAYPPPNPHPTPPHTLPPPPRGTLSTPWHTVAVISQSGQMM